MNHSDCNVHHRRWTQGAHRACAIALALTLQLTLQTAVANGNSSSNTPCLRSAGDMQQACKFDTADDLQESIARCRQLAANDERRSCYADAYAERRENREICGAQFQARTQACKLLGERRYLDPLTDPANSFIDPNDIPALYPNNPYLILQAGHTFVLAEEDAFVVVHVTDESREILGAQCRIVVDIVVEEGIDEEDGEVDYEAVEVTDDWFAQDTESNVYYCGEVARNYDDGVLRDLDGSFEAGLDYAFAGFLIKAMPTPPMVHRQEYALGEAEDILEYLELNATPSPAEGGDNEAFPCAGGCLKTREFAPLEPEGSEFKYFLPGVGFVLAVALENGEITGEREELVCSGDSLEVLSDPVCGIEDPDELLEDLCELSEAFCEDDDDDD
jgi:hypothetical protein